MREEMLGRLWDAHHDDFSTRVDRALGLALARLRSPRLRDLPVQLFAAVAAVGLTLITFTGSTA